MKKLILAAAAVFACTTTLSANEFEGAMQDFLVNSIAPWATDPLIVAAIDAQNAVTASYDQATIDEMDQLWRAQVGMDGAELIDDVLNNDAAAFLRQQVDGAGGAITEVFVMDARGLNVAASAVTSDYWQGDEAKFQQTYGVGASAVHFGEVEMDDSTEELQAQVSMTITDQTTGAIIGALTVGINLTALM